MICKPPKDDTKYQWTQHVQDKMRYYGISESLIKRITRFPKRTEEGIAPKTIAVMQPTPNKKKPQEVWVMYQAINQKSNLKNQSSKFQVSSSKKKIISAWRYPGVSPLRGKIPIPDDIVQELEGVLE